MEYSIKKGGENNRNYSIDILRIISMLMIVSLHFFSYNSAVTEIDSFSATGFLKHILHSVSLISVNCYILISGYYIHKFKFSLYKLLKILCEVLFYSIILYLLFLQTNLAHLTVKELLLAATPTLTRQYWFVTTYVGVYILSPIISDVINLLDRKIHSLIIFCGFILFVVYYNFFFFCDNLNFGGSTGIVWFIYLYFCASYIQRYNVGKGKRNVLRYILCAFLALGSEVPFILLYVFTKRSIFFEGATIFNSVYNSIFVFISSILFFVIFTNMRLDFKSIHIKKMISFLAKGSFAVYLIHENKYMRIFLWNTMAINISYGPLTFVAYWMISVISIYIFCATVDWIRQRLEKYLFDKHQKNIKQIEDKLQKIINSILIKL